MGVESVGTSSSEGPRERGPRTLRIAIWLVIAVVVIDLILFVYFVYNDLLEFTSLALPNPPTYFFEAFYAATTLSMPLLFVAVALLVHTFVRARSGTAYLGRNLLVAGAIIDIVGASINVVSYLNYWQSIQTGFSQADFRLTAIASTISAIGFLLIVVSAALLLVGYARGSVVLTRPS